MMKIRSLFLLFGLSLTGGGVYAAEPDGRAVFRAMQKAVMSTGAMLEKSLVHIEMSGLVKGAKKRRTFRGMRSPNSLHLVTGIILDKEGHILMPLDIDPEKLERIRVWLDDTEFAGTFIQASDKLKMSVIKINTDIALTPLDLTRATDPKIGECLITVVPLGEKYEFEKITSMMFTRGERMIGRYRQIIAGIRNPGVPAITIDGEVAGIVVGGQLLAMKDLNTDLVKLLKKVRDGGKGEFEDKEKKDKKPWLGALFRAVNDDYAKLKKYPRGAIWVTNVIEGSPAALASLKAHDIVMEVNGHPVKKTHMNALSYFLRFLDPEYEEPFTMKVLRGDKTIAIKGTFGSKPERTELKADDIGIEIQDMGALEVLTKNLFTKKGVLIKSIRPGSPASVSVNFGSSVLAKNDVIVRMDGRSITSVKAFSAILDTFRKKNAAVLLMKVIRGKRHLTVGLNMKIGKELIGG